MDRFEKELKVAFLEEAEQMMAEAEQCFLTLEKSQDSETLNQIFRLAHNLKGSAKAVGFTQLGEFVHELESLLLKLKNGQVRIHNGIVSLLLRCNDQIREIVKALKTDLDANVDSTALLNELSQVLEGPPPPSAPSVETKPPVENPLPENLSPPLSENSPSQPEEAAVSSEPSAPPFSELDNFVTESLEKATPVIQTISNSDESIRVNLSRLEKLINYVGEMVILQSVLKELSIAQSSLILQRTVEQASKVSKEIQDISMGLRMVPIRATFLKMQRIVRDTSAALGKKIELILEGENTEVDKTILEALNDPLVHLIRNAADHGIEMPDDRVKNGKSECGTIHLRAFHQSGKLIVEIQDDGGGMDPDKLIAKANEKKLIKPGTELSKKDALSIIFLPGFSTKSEVTDISGRGVGMDVVKTNIESLLGDISISSEIGKGSCFRLQLPLTLAIIDGLTISCGADRYVIPRSQIQESLQVDQANIDHSSETGELFMLRGQSIPLYYLENLLQKSSRFASDTDRQKIALVMNSGESLFALVVDDIIGQYQIVIKKLGEDVQHLRGFSGSTILGDGKPALILEVVDLIKKYGFIRTGQSHVHGQRGHAL